MRISELVIPRNAVRVHGIREAIAEAKQLQADGKNEVIYVRCQGGRGQYFISDILYTGGVWLTLTKPEDWPLSEKVYDAMQDGAGNVLKWDQ